MRSRDAMLLALTCVAGLVDAISYLELGHVFTAMMTGNTVLLALALGQGEAMAALRSILALVAFSAGAAGRPRGPARLADRPGLEARGTAGRGLSGLRSGRSGWHRSPGEIVDAARVVALRRRCGGRGQRIPVSPRARAQRFVTRWGHARFGPVFQN